jgi:hypothetical protein
MCAAYQLPPRDARREVLSVLPSKDKHTLGATRFNQSSATRRRPKIQPSMSSPVS